MSARKLSALEAARAVVTSEAAAAGAVGLVPRSSDLVLVVHFDKRFCKVAFVRAEAVPELAGFSRTQPWPGARRYVLRGSQMVHEIGWTGGHG